LSEFRRGWKPLFAATAGTMTGASPIPFNVVPVLIGPLVAEFGWSRLQVNLSITIYGVIAALLAPLYGLFADNLGVRPVAITCLALFGLVFACGAYIPGTLTGFYGLFVAIGLIGIGSTPVTWSRAVGLWFVRHRGLALGIMLLGTSLAGIIVPQIARAAVQASGWRMAFVWVAALPLVVGLPIALLLFREPRPEERPAGLADASGELTGLSAGAAVASRRFWTMWLSVLLAATAYGGAHINMVQIAGLHGLGLAAATSVLSVTAVGILLGRVLTGLLLDRFWAPGVALPVLLLPALGCWLLIGTAPGTTPLFIGGFLLGFAAGAESDLIGFIAARYFGMRSYGRVYGLLYMPFGLGAAISPAIYGYVRDTSGTYDPMLTAAVAMFAAAGLLLLTLGRYPVFGEAHGDAR